jgi:hypothetical protein
VLPRQDGGAAKSGQRRCKEYYAASSSERGCYLSRMVLRYERRMLVLPGPNGGAKSEGH